MQKPPPPVANCVAPKSLTKPPSNLQQRGSSQPTRNLPLHSTSFQPPQVHKLLTQELAPQHHNSRRRCNKVWVATSQLLGFCHVPDFWLRSELWSSYGIRSTHRFKHFDVWYVSFHSSNADTSEEGQGNDRSSEIQKLLSIFDVSWLVGQDLDFNLVIEIKILVDASVWICGKSSFVALTRRKVRKNREITTATNQVICLDFF